MTDTPFPGGVTPRHGFQRPALIVPPMTEAGWSAVSPAPLLVSAVGDAARLDCDARLAWDATSLWVRAAWRDPAPSVDPELPLGGARFWRQDHVDLRLCPDPARPNELVAFLFGLDGRWWDNRGHWREGAGVAYEATRDGEQISLCARIDWAILPVERPEAGDELIAQFTRITWPAERLTLAATSPVPLGLQQSGQFSAFRFAGASERRVGLSGIHPASAAFHTGENEASVGLNVAGDAALDARLRVHRTDELPGDSAARSVACRLEPGENRVPVGLELTRPGYRRFAFELLTEAGREDLGAVTVRAGQPYLAIDAAPRRHPFVLFDERDVERWRGRLATPPWDRLAGDLSITDEDLDPPELPAPGEAPAPAIDARSVRWSRMAKETMIRDGEGGLDPAAAHLWGLQSEEAKAAWRRAQRDVEPSDADRDLLVRELNRVLAEPAFYDHGVFGDMELPSEAVALWHRGLESLDPQECFLFNRIVLQTAFPFVNSFKSELAAIPVKRLIKWLATGDTRLVETATRAVRAARESMIIGPWVDLGEGGRSRGLAIAYDAMAPALDEEARADWHALLKRYLEMYLRTARAQHWNTTCIPNANPVCNGGGGMLAIALWDAFPEMAREALDYARARIRNWLDYCAGHDGGNTEGAQYWQYGTESFLDFATALERFTGRDEGLLDHPAIRNSMNMVRVGLTNDGSMHGVNDTIPLPVGAAMGWFAAGRFGDELGRWYGDHSLRVCEGRIAEGRKCPYQPGILRALLYRPSGPETREAPELPTDVALRSIEYAALRSEPRWDATLVAGLKGARPPYTHHNQPDTGAFYCHARGERLLIDPGYYNGAPTDHCLPVIDGTSPRSPDDYTGRIDDHGSAGDLRWVIADVTPAFRGAAKRFVRHLVMVGSEGLVVLDDIEPAGPGEVTAWYQAGGATSLAGEGSRVEIAGEAAALRLEWPCDPEPAPQLQPERDFNTHWGYHFAACRWFPLSLAHAAAGERPLVTVALDATRGKPSPSTASTETTSAGPIRWIGLPSGRAVAFRRFDGRWRFDPEASAPEG